MKALGTWLRYWTAAFRPAGTAARSGRQGTWHVRPRVEPLEDRSLPSAITGINPYGGGIPFAASSPSLSQPVQKIGTSTTVVSSAIPSVVGQPVSFTATVTPALAGGPTPSGWVTFLVDGVTTMKVALDGSGQAVFTTSSLRLGVHMVAAEYSGSTDYLPSMTNFPTFVVDQAPGTAGTQTTVHSSASPFLVGQTVTFAATVSAVSGFGTPTGFVTFLVNGVPHVVTIGVAPGVAGTVSNSTTAGNSANAQQVGSQLLTAGQEASSPRSVPVATTASSASAGGGGVNAAAPGTASVGAGAGSGSDPGAVLVIDAGGFTTSTTNMALPAAAELISATDIGRALLLGTQAVADFLPSKNGSAPVATLLADDANDWSGRPAGNGQEALPLGDFLIGLPRQPDAGSQEQPAEHKPNRSGAGLPSPMPSAGKDGGHGDAKDRAAPQRSVSLVVAAVFALGLVNWGGERSDDHADRDD